MHKKDNILNDLPKGVQSKPGKRIHEIYLAETRQQALKSYEEFFQAKFPEACECLAEDAFFTFYHFPAKHWMHLRSTNPIESTFFTVRLRTVRTKGCGSRETTLTMVYKLAEQAERHWRNLNSAHLIPLVIEGVKFVDGVIEEAAWNGPGGTYSSSSPIHKI